MRCLVLSANISFMGYAISEPFPLIGEIYETFQRELLSEMLKDVPLVIRRRMWFQHDAAPARSPIPEQRIPNRFVGRNGPVAWPQRFPNRTH